MANLSTTLWLASRFRRLERHDGWSRARLEAHQAKALSDLQAHAYAHSPFYRLFHEGLEDRPLQELPVLTKALLMEHFDDLVTDRQVRLQDLETLITGSRPGPLFLGKYRVCVTGGSTGRRGIFVFDASEWATILASYARAYAWAGQGFHLTHRAKLATVASATPWHLSAHLRADLGTWWSPALRLNIGDPTGVLVQQLNHWQPEILASYPSTLRILANEQLAGGLQVHPGYIFSSAEVLSDETRQRIEAAWGHRLFNLYGSSEGGNMGAECPEHRGIHLFEDLILFEVVDANYDPVPPGVYGDRVLITVLFSRTLPLIRYELSDNLRLAAGDCPCGRPYRLVESIRGRSEDILYFPAPGGEVAVHPNVFKEVFEQFPTGEWQVVQEPEGLRVLVVGLSDEDSDLEAVLRQALAERGVVVPVALERVATIPRSAVGKAPLVKCNLPLEPMVEPPVPLVEEP